MADVYVDYGKFEGYASDIETKNKALKQELDDIESYITGLSGSWESDSATTIRSKIKGMESRFEQYFSVVDNYVKVIRNTAEAFKAAEKTNDSNAQQFI